MRAALLSGRFSANALSGLTARGELRTHTFVPSLKVFFRLTQRAVQRRTHMQNALSFCTKREESCLQRVMHLGRAKFIERTCKMDSPNPGCIHVKDNRVKAKPFFYHVRLLPCTSRVQGPKSCYVIVHLHRPIRHPPPRPELLYPSQPPRLCLRLHLLHLPRPGRNFRQGLVHALHGAVLRPAVNLVYLCFKFIVSAQTA
jgi:hypothetical protein